MNKISEFVYVLKERFPDGADLVNPDVADALIRHAFGEEGLLDDMDVEEIRVLLFLLPYAVVSELGIEGGDLDAFVAQVITEADTLE